MAIRVLPPLLALSLALIGGLSIALSAPAPQGQAAPEDERFQGFERQEITVPDFQASGFILDIGGGGEGIIGRMKSTQVIAIDISKRELEEAPAGPLKIVMDASDLQFLDSTFNTATIFYTLMYMREEVQAKTLQEVHRVLSPGGRLLIWDVEIPAQSDPKKKGALFPFLFHLPDKNVGTGYGVAWPPRLHDMAYYTSLAQKTGFQLVEKKLNGRSFFLELKKN